MIKVSDDFEKAALHAKVVQRPKSTRTAKGQHPFVRAAQNPRVLAGAVQRPKLEKMAARCSTGFPSSTRREASKGCRQTACKGTQCLKPQNDGYSAFYSSAVFDILTLLWVLLPSYLLHANRLTYMVLIF